MKSATKANSTSSYAKIYQNKKLKSQTQLIDKNTGQQRSGRSNTQMQSSTSQSQKQDQKSSNKTPNMQSANQNHLTPKKGDYMKHFHGKPSYDLSEHQHARRIQTEISANKNSIINLNQIEDCNPQKNEGRRIYDYLYNKDTTIDQLLKKTAESFYKNQQGKKVDFPIKNVIQQSQERILTNEKFIKTVNDYEIHKEKQKIARKESAKQRSLQLYKSLKSKENIITGENYKKVINEGKNLVQNMRHASPSMKVCIEQNLHLLRGENINTNNKFHRKYFQHSPLKRQEKSQDSYQKNDFLQGTPSKNIEDTFKSQKKFDSTFKSTNDSHHVQSLLRSLNKIDLQNNQKTDNQMGRYAQMNSASRKRNNSQDIQNIMSQSILSNNNNINNNQIQQQQSASRSRRSITSNLEGKFRMRNEVSQETREAFNYCQYN